MKWQEAREFLSRFAITRPASQRKSAVCAALEPYGIGEEHIAVFGSVVRLRGVHPALRSEVALHRAEILERIRHKTGNWCMDIT